MASAPKPVALYPTHIELTQIDLSEYADLDRFLASGEPWWRSHWAWGQEFLNYIGRNKSEYTYTRFRNETERFLTWVFLFKLKPLDQLRKADILDYADFCWQPPASWICFANYEKFVFENGFFTQNPKWAPFKLQLPKNAQAGKQPNKKKYKPSQQTLTAMFAALSSFYKYLVNEEYLYGNPCQPAKKDCRHFITDAQVKDVRRLSDEEWQYVLRVANKLADEDPLYERSFFVITALKVLFLRISELSERKNWSPVMSHFWQDTGGNWWLKVLGKGRKIRDITVPSSFIGILKRYRGYRGLSPLPATGENEPIVEKIRGQGGMTSRQLTRIVQNIFDHAYDVLLAEKGADSARKLKEASTHWLRHTGASMEIERGRALKDLSEDLGHASMSTTDIIYVQSEDKKRAESGKARKI